MKNLPSNRASLLIRARSSARTSKWLIIGTNIRQFRLLVLAIFGLRCLKYSTASEIGQYLWFRSARLQSNSHHFDRRWTMTADELIAGQYAGRPHLRAIFDAIIKAATECGEIVIQARKTYVSLVAPRRTFARIKPLRNQVDLGLRLEQC